jgi:hypothetical protein
MGIICHVCNVQVIFKFHPCKLEHVNVNWCIRCLNFVFQRIMSATGVWYTQYLHGWLVVFGDLSIFMALYWIAGCYHPWLVSYGKGILVKKGLYCTLSCILFCAFYELLACNIWLFSTDLSNCACITGMGVKLLLLLNHRMWYPLIFLAKGGVSMENYRFGKCAVLLEEHGTLQFLQIW